MLRRFGMAAIATLALTMPAVPASAAGPRQVASFTFGEQRPGQATEMTFRARISNPDDPAAKPPAVREIYTRLAPGARYDVSVWRRCRASDAEMSLRGSAACAGADRTGEGTMTLNTGFPGRARRLAVATDFFTDGESLIFLNTVRGEITGTPLPLHFVTHAPLGETETFNPGPFIVGAPPDGTAAETIYVKDYRRSAVVGGRRVNFITTPPRCPRSGFWVNQVRFTYADGVVETVDSPSPCRRATRVRPGRARLRRS